MTSPRRRRLVTLATINVAPVMRLVDRSIWHRVVNDVADAAVIQWDQLVVQSMSPPSARAYRAGITKAEPMPGVVVLTLAGVYPLMVERGWHSPGGINLRVTMLRPGQKGVRTSKDGHRYRRVMFRHGTQGGAGAGYAGEDIGTAERRVLGWTEQQAAARSAFVQTFAKGLRPYHGRGKYGASPKGTKGAPKWLEAGLVSKLRDRHVTDIYAGMRRMGKKSGGGYRTFRTISSNPAAMRSDSGGLNWHHPGIRPRRLVPKVRQYVQTILPHVLRAVIDSSKGTTP